MSENIDKFNYYVGLIFAELQENFPRRVRLNTLQLIGAEKSDATIDESGNYTGIYLKDGIDQDLDEELDFVFETAHWLHATGYLIGSVGTTNIGRHITVTLSPKTLEILKVMPASIDNGEKPKSIGQEISEAVKSSAKKQIGDLASQALSSAVKFGWNIVTNP